MVHKYVLHIYESNRIFLGNFWPNTVELIGSNTFGTIQISSIQGLFEPMRVDNSARSGSIIGIIIEISFRVS